MSIDQVAEQGATGDPVHDPDREACVVCLDEAKTHILIPCGHQCVWSAGRAASGLRRATALYAALQ